MFHGGPPGYECSRTRAPRIIKQTRYSCFRDLFMGLSGRKYGARFRGVCLIVSSGSRCARSRNSADRMFRSIPSGVWCTHPTHRFHRNRLGTPVFWDLFIGLANRKARGRVPGVCFYMGKKWVHCATRSQQECMEGQKSTQWGLYKEKQGMYFEVSKVSFI